MAAYSARCKALSAVCTRVRSQACKPISPSPTTARPGVFRLDGDKLALAWKDAHNEPCYERLDAALRDPSSKMPAVTTSKTRWPAPSWGISRPPPIHSAAAPWGAKPADGVVNHKSEVFDTSHGRGSNAVHDGLYVIDGSIIPRSLGVNPLFTITALSERALAHMLADRRLSANELPPLSKPIPANTPAAIMAAE